MFCRGGARIRMAMVTDGTCATDKVAYKHGKPDTGTKPVSP